jgi:hypothetical protein
MNKGFYKWNHMVDYKLVWNPLTAMEIAIKTHKKSKPVYKFFFSHGEFRKIILNLENFSIRLAEHLRMRFFLSL